LISVYLQAVTRPVIFCTFASEKLPYCAEQPVFQSIFQNMQKTGPKAGFSASIGVYMEKKFVFIS